MSNFAAGPERPKPYSPRARAPHDSGEPQMEPLRARGDRDAAPFKRRTRSSFRAQFMAREDHSRLPLAARRSFKIWWIGDWTTCLRWRRAGCQRSCKRYFLPMTDMTTTQRATNTDLLLSRLQASVQTTESQDLSWHSAFKVSRSGFVSLVTALSISAKAERHSVIMVR